MSGVHRAKSASRQRLARGMMARLRPLLPGDAALIAAVAGMAERWVLAEPGLVASDRLGRLRLAPEAWAGLALVTRTLRWMADPKRHHGQQATELGRKTLRAAREGRLDWETLAERCRAFRVQRQAGIRRNAAARLRGEAMALALPGSDAVATRIVTERDLVRLGREARNCLAGSAQGRRYRNSLRHGVSEFWRLDHPHHGLLCVAEVDCAGLPRSLDQAEGPDGAPLSAFAAAALLEFLRRRDVRVGESGELAWHGICDEFVMAPGEPERLNVELDGNPSRLAIVPGAVLGTCARSGEVWLLRSVPKGFSDRPLACSSAADDFDAVGQPSYACEARLRQWLRRACHDDARLARACANAFVEAPDWFREDWFGVPAARKAGR